jgi:hypothetical protein
VLARRHQPEKLLNGTRFRTEAQHTHKKKPATEGGLAQRRNDLEQCELLDLPGKCLAARRRFGPRLEHLEQRGSA